MSQLLLIFAVGAILWCLCLWVQARRRVELAAVEACRRCKVTFVRGSLRLRALRWISDDGRPGLRQAYSFQFLDKNGRVGHGGAVARGSELVDMHLDLDVDALNN